MPKQTLTEIVAFKIKTLRLRKKLSQGALAEKAGLSVSYISMLEREVRSPPLETVERLAKALHVKPLDLLGGVPVSDAREKELQGRRLVSAAEVRARFGVSEATLWRRVKDGSFPKPVYPLGTRRKWFEADLEAFEDRLRSAK